MSSSEKENIASWIKGYSTGLLHHSTGQFELSPDKLEEKLRNFQFEDPSIFVVLLVAVATELQAGYVHVQDWGDFEFVEFGANLDPRLFVGQSIYRIHANSSLEMNLLAAIRAALQCRYKYLDVEVGSLNTVSTFRYRAETSEFTLLKEYQQSKAKFSRFVFHKSFKDKLRGRGKCYEHRWASLLRERCRHAPLNIYQDTRQISVRSETARQTSTNDAMFQFEGEALKISVAFGGNSFNFKAVVVVALGVSHVFASPPANSEESEFFEQFGFLSALENCEIIISTGYLPTDISHKDLRLSKELRSSIDSVESKFMCALFSQVISQVIETTDPDILLTLFKFISHACAHQRYRMEPKLKRFSLSTLAIVWQTIAVMNGAQLGLYQPFRERLTEDIIAPLVSEGEHRYATELISALNIGAVPMPQEIWSMDESSREYWLQHHDEQVAIRRRVKKMLDSDTMLLGRDVEKFLGVHPGFDLKSILLRERILWGPRRDSGSFTFSILEPASMAFGFGTLSIGSDSLTICSFSYVPHRSLPYLSFGLLFSSICPAKAARSLSIAAYICFQNSQEYYSHWMLTEALRLSPEYESASVSLQNLEAKGFRSCSWAKMCLDLPALDLLKSS